MVVLKLFLWSQGCSLKVVTKIIILELVLKWTFFLQVGVHFGVCKNTTAANAAPTATNTAGMFSGSVQLTGHASTIHFSTTLYLFSLSSVMVLFLL